MNCRYCGTWNADDEHRCERCGRRLDLTGRPGAEAHGRAAVALSAVPEPDAEAPAVVQPQPAPRVTSPQGTLFGPPAPRVLQFPNARREPRSSPPPDPAPEVPRMRTETVRRSPRKRSVEGQQNLPFGAPPLPRTSPSSAHIICCDAAVAPVLARVLAVALDLSIVLIAVSLFFGVLVYRNVPLVFNSWTIPCYAAAVLLIAALYRGLWLVANGDTAGMRWVGLRLVNFDGYAPSRATRVQRLAASFLSVCAAGLGLLWGLADEESLTWHDHISKTFPTPAGE